MKKIILPVVALLITCSGLFAMDISKVGYRVLNNFEASYPGAEDVNWTVKPAFTKASFSIDGESFEAFYSSNGNFIGVSKKVDLKALPKKAVKQIQQKYAEYKIVETVLFDFDGQSNYFVSLEKNGVKKILEVTLGGTVSKYEGALN
jgi:hypothetical protein